MSLQEVESYLASLHSFVHRYGHLPPSQPTSQEAKERRVKVARLRELSLARKLAKFHEKHSGSYRFEAGIERPRKLGACLSVAQILETMGLDLGKEPK